MCRAWTGEGACPPLDAGALILEWTAQAPRNVNRPFFAAAFFLLLSAQAPPPAALPDAAHVLAFLNRTIAWAERLDAQAQLADQPTDVLYVNDDRQLARQVVALSFEAVKAETPLLTLTNAQA